MKVRKIPMRMCVGCKQMKSKKEAPEDCGVASGEIEVDRTGKKSGRGAYICDNLDCFQKAMNLMAWKGH